MLLRECSRHMLAIYMPKAVTATLNHNTRKGFLESIQAGFIFFNLTRTRNL